MQSVQQRQKQKHDWYVKNRDKRKKQNHAWYMKNREEQLQKHKEWQQNNHEKYLEYQKQYQKTYEDKTILQRVRKYEQKYPHKTKAHMEIYKLWQRGIIDKQIACAICEKKSDVCHHFDYFLPLCVVHLCKGCHRQLHSDDLLNKEIKEVYMYESYICNE